MKYPVSPTLVEERLRALPPAQRDRYILPIWLRRRFRGHLRAVGVYDPTFFNEVLLTLDADRIARRLRRARWFGCNEA